jgi:hypothetical protein
MGIIGILKTNLKKCIFTDFYLHRKMQVMGLLKKNNSGRKNIFFHKMVGLCLSAYQYWGPEFRTRTPIWDPNLGPQFGTPIWDPDLGPRFGTRFETLIFFGGGYMGPLFGTLIWDVIWGVIWGVIWDPALVPRFGTLIWDPNLGVDMGPPFGTLIWGVIWDPDLGPQFGTLI